jgi:peptide/nickel transport system substrate-binding protein
MSDTGTPKHSASGARVFERQISRRSFLLATGAIGVAAALEPARTFAARTTRSAAQSLTIAVPNAPASWDQDYIAFDLTGLALDKNYYPYMVDYPVKTLAGAQIQNTSQVLPVYAESWVPNANATVWTLKIRKGLTFPSGNPLTAADIKWSKDRAFAAKANVAGVYSLIGLTEPGQVKVLDDSTVQFTQSYPSALSSAVQVISLYVFDSKLMQQHATAADPWAKQWASQNPTSGGAYNVTSHSESAIALAANTQFPGSPKPAIATVNLSVTPSSADQRLELQNGAIDIATGLSSQDIRSLKGVSGVKVLGGPNNAFNFIALDVTHPPFDDVRVRQALAWAIPYQPLLTTVYGGDARLSTSIVPLDMPGSSPVGYPYSYNPTKAKALLKAAGMSSGLSAQLVIAEGAPDQQQIAILVQNALKQVGVDISIEPLDPATLNTGREKKTIRMQIGNGQYWVNDVQYMVGTSLIPGGYLNYSNYSNPQITKLYNLSAHSADQAKRMGYFHQMQVILGKDVPWLMIGQPNFALPVRTSVTGWVQPVDGLFRLQYLKNS